METTTNFGSKLGTAILDFIDRVPGVIPSILTVVIVVGYWLFG